MKNLINFLAIALMLSSVILVGCKKQDFNVDQTNSFQGKHSFANSIKKIETGIDQEGILSIESEEAYLKALKELEELDKNSGIENESSVLFEFATAYNFNSLFVDIYEKEEKWLNETDGSNIEEDPDNHFVTDYYERTLYNTRTEVAINNKIYKKLENGHLIINSLDFSVLSQLRSTIDLHNLPAGVEFIGDLYDSEGNSLMGSCKSSKRKTGYENNSTNSNRIKWIIEVNNPLVGENNVKAHVRNYKCKDKDGNKCNRWSKVKALCEAKVEGQAGVNCASPSLFTNSSYSTCTCKSVYDKVIIPDRAVKSGWVTGKHEGINGSIIYNSTLTF